MKIYRIANLAVLSFVLSIGFAAAARANDKAVPGWDPAVFRDASTIKIMTTEPEVGEHWSSLWVVVIDGQPYVRLGDRAYGRIQRNTTSPYVKLKVADRKFDKVKVEEMPDMKQKVGAAMADKYWMDILVRHESHPMVARLVPETPSIRNAILLFEWLGGPEGCLVALEATGHYWRNLFVSLQETD